MVKILRVKAKEWNLGELQHRYRSEKTLVFYREAAIVDIVV